MPTRLSIISLALSLLAALPVIGCNADKPKPAGPTPVKRTIDPAAVKPWSSPMQVVVSIPPLKGLVEPLLPPGSTVTVLIPPGTSEHGYEVPPAQLLTTVKADMLVWIGGMEASVDKLTTGNQRFARYDLRLSDELGLSVEACTHDHGAGAGTPHHHGDDPHIWLDPQQARRIVKVVAEGVKRVRIDSDGPHEADTAATALDARLVALDADYQRGLKGASVRKIVVGHDAYGWLARRYTLETVAIAGLNAGEPTPAALTQARQTVVSHGLKVVFAEPQLGDAAARSIAAATGAKVLMLDPLGDGDYFAMMRANLTALRKGLGLEVP